MDLPNQLKRCYLCRELDSAELQELAAICQVRQLSRGEILFFQGDPAIGLYLLFDGLIRVYKAAPDGKEFTLHQIRAGEMFAEAAIFRGDGYPANSAALKDSTVALLPKEPFLGLLMKSPQVTVKMMGGLSSFLREFNRTIENLSLKDVPARLASYLLAEYEKTGRTTVHLATTKAELANQLGTVGETLSRNFRKCREKGLIAVDGTRIELLDLDGLYELAAGEKI
jgi:CRP/FNR family transcriptional regulator